MKRGEDRRLRAGHLWVFSNEVDVATTPLTSFSPGDLVELQTANAQPLGTGYVNPHSLICVRLISRHAARQLDRSLLVHRLNIALSHRRRVYQRPFYRLVYGEGDGLPGLIVDRFGDVLVVQITTAGMERQLAAVISALEKVIAPKGILLRNDSPMRSLEGLDSYIRVASGAVPDEAEVVEGEARFHVSLRAGQKTGWYYDQYDNRRRLGRYVTECRVLDVFSYVGGFAMAAATAGATEVLAVEASDDASERILRNAQASGCRDRVTAIHGDAQAVMEGLRAEGERFDVVVLDPPAFIKRKKDIKKGTEAYRGINQLAMRLLSKNGLLVSNACSFHLERGAFRQLLQRGGRHLDRTIQIVEQGHQSPDHPIHPAIPETEYLKSLYTRVLAP